MTCKIENDLFTRIKQIFQMAYNGFIGASQDGFLSVHVRQYSFFLNFVFTRDAVIDLII